MTNNNGNIKVEQTDKLDKPKYTGFMTGWCVFLGFYQIFLASKYGGLFLGSNNLATLDLTSQILIVLYASIGIVVFILAYAVWNLKWWGYPLYLILQGGIIVIALMGILRWALLGQAAPIAWDALDLIFAAINLSWALSFEVRTVFGCNVLKKIHLYQNKES